MFKFVLAVALSLVPSIASAAHYEVTQKIDTASGTLQVLEDSRLKPSIQKKMWETCTDIFYLFELTDPLARPFLREKVLPAKLQQIGQQGVITAMIPNEAAPIARIEPKRLRSSSGDFFLLDTNDSACMGSYSGMGVGLYQFKQGVIAQVTADEDGKKVPIYFFRSLKSDWRFVTKTPQQIVAEQLLCRPDFVHETRNNVPFLLTYITFRYQKNHWEKLERSLPGFWEADQPFPQESQFP